MTGLKLSATEKADLLTAMTQQLAEQKTEELKLKSITRYWLLSSPQAQDIVIFLSLAHHTTTRFKRFEQNFLCKT